MAKHRPQLIEYLGGKCSHCNKDIKNMVERYGEVHRMYKFHHVIPEEKASDYSKLIERNIHKEQLDEVDKCILLCGNCHDILHAQSIDGKVSYQIEIDGRSANQILNGSYIFDKSEGIAKFLTNEKLYISPYLLQVGDEKEQKLVFGTDLNDGLMVECLQKIREYEKVILYRYGDESEVFKAEVTDHDAINISYDIGLELPWVLDGACMEDGAQIGWVRNGVALLKDGKVITEGRVNFTIDIPLNSA